MNKINQKRRFRLVIQELNESLKMALEAIRDNKLRSTLTLLGIVIGVFSVIGVMTAIRTLESSLEKGLNIFGSNTFGIQKYPAISLGWHSRMKYHNRKNITLDQFEKVKERAQKPKTVSVGDDKWGMTVKYDDRRTKGNVVIHAGDEWTLKNFNMFIADGRNVTHEDNQFYRKVCVLGMDVVDLLFPFEDPLGKVVEMDGQKYLVIGITERSGQMFGESRDNFITIPISTYLNKYGSSWTSLDITVEALSAELYEETMDEVVGILRTIRKLPPGEDNDFEVVSNQTLLDTIGSFTGGVKIFAFVISIIALVVAGIGIMNIMLVSVTERIKEIGIRKAVGATRKNILVQFLMEAVFLSEFGGIIGVALGIAGGNVVAVVFDIPAVIPIDWAIYGLLVCSLIGIGFGSYPAYRAAKLDPIESLRHE
ncbi:MAG: ABC transporter permease [Candidatus Marinimicrobia bacterium]|nr:ABC transporter permease [Candidatus Neomarinimicrobiota bacterium]